LDKIVLRNFIFESLEFIAQGVSIVHHKDLIFSKAYFFGLNVIELPVDCNSANDQKNRNNKLEYDK